MNLELKKSGKTVFTVVRNHRSRNQENIFYFYEKPSRINALLHCLFRNKNYVSGTQEIRKICFYRCEKPSLRLRSRQARINALLHCLFRNKNYESGTQEIRKICFYLCEKPSLKKSGKYILFL